MNALPIIGFVLVAALAIAFAIIPLWRVAEKRSRALLWAAAALTLFTGYDYLRAGLIHLTEETPAVQAAKPTGAT